MKEKINYIIFGILTVIVNLSIFYELLYFFNDNNNITHCASSFFIV